MDELVNEPSNIPQGSQKDGEEGSEHDPSTQVDDEPLYVKLYEKTHRHATTGLDPEAAVNLQALKDLLQKEMQENGVDVLTSQEAYTKVFKNCSGYIRGLGFGPKLAKRVVLNAEVRDEIQQIKQAYDERESALQDEIQRLKQEMIERENKLKQDMMAEMARMIQNSS